LFSTDSTLSTTHPLEKRGKLPLSIEAFKPASIRKWPCPEKRDNELRVASEFIKELTFGLLRSFP